MDLFELSRAIDNLIPVSLREPWDNDGLMVAPERGSDVTRALIALDATSRAIERAVSVGAQVIITHHPLVFHPLTAVSKADPVGSRVISCINNRIAVLSYHTRLDTVEGGVNDCLAEALGLKNAAPFLPFGRLGEIESEMSFERFVKHSESVLGEKACAAVNRGGTVKKVAVVSGSGKDFVREAFAAGADVYVTGEASHDSLIDAAELGMNMVCLTHHATERVVLPALGGFVKKASGGAVEPVIFDFDRVNEYGV